MYYEKIGKIPESWVICKFGEIVNICRGASPRPIKEHLTFDSDGIPWIKIGDTKPGDIYIERTAQRIKKESAKHSVYLKAGSLILSNSMSFGRPYILKINGCIHDGWLAIETFDNTINLEFLQYLLQGYMWFFKSKATGTGVDNLNIDRVKEMPFALPPLKEQKRILERLLEFDKIINQINQYFVEIKRDASLIKSKILDNIFGNDSSYKSYYKKTIKLGDLLNYEQPGPYIVSSADYDDSYQTPVLTPGKTFILGYTNETHGIYHPKNKVIIFDDFTTASRIVDFDFKVKSSAMKILSSSDAEKYDIDYLNFLLKTINVINDTHKRYWISEYAPIELKIHDIVAQKEIVRAIKQSFEIIDRISHE